MLCCELLNNGGGQTVSIIVTEQTFESTYEDMNVSRKVLSRTLEDSGTLSAPIVPWGVATIYVMGVLGCSTTYIPYAWFIFVVPIFSMICAITGIGIWDKEEKACSKINVLYLYYLLELVYNLNVNEKRELVVQAERRV